MTALLTYVFGALWLLVSLTLGMFALWRKMNIERMISENEFVDRVIGFGLGAYLISGLVLWFLGGPVRGALGLPIHTVTGVFPTLEPLTLALFFFFLYRFSGGEWKDHYELLDYCVVPLTTFLGYIAIGQFLSTVLGLATSSFAGTTIAFNFHDLYWLAAAAFFFALGFILAMFERTYRTFLWYRYRRSSAQSGFVFAVFLIASGLFGVTIGWIKSAVLTIGAIAIEPPLWLLVMVVGFVILYLRSGRGLIKR